MYYRDAIDLSALEAYGEVQAHARACERGLWTLNEKRLLATAGLGALGDAFTRLPESASGWASWVDEIDHALEA